MGLLAESWAFFVAIKAVLGSDFFYFSIFWSVKSESVVRTFAVRYCTRVRDKQALRLSSGSSHVETQNFTSDIVICIHFYRHCPSEMQNFAPLHVADSRPEACIPFRTNENPYLELAYIVSFPHSSSAYALLSASCIPPCLGAARYAFGLPKISLSDSNA